MSPERRHLFPVEYYQGLAGNLNRELGGGASVWREDMFYRIREFPNPVLFDLDDTLIWYNPRMNETFIRSQARQILARAARVGSVFIVTAGVINADDLIKLGLGDNQFVLITRQNYGYSGEREVPSSAAEEVRKYIAMQEALGIQYQESDFDLADLARKHLAPIFMKPYRIPLIDNSFAAIVNNPGIWGIAISDPSQLEYQKEVGDDFGQAITRYLSQTMDDIENYYFWEEKADRILDDPCAKMIELNDLEIIHSRKARDLMREAGAAITIDESFARLVMIRWGISTHRYRFNFENEVAKRIFLTLLAEASQCEYEKLATIKDPSIDDRRLARYQATDHIGDCVRQMKERTFQLSPGVYLDLDN